MKLFLTATGLFVCVGLVLAREMLSRFGMEANYLLIAVLAMVFTAFLAGRSLVLMGVVLLLSVALNIPSETFGSLAIDQDLLLAVMFGVIILPVVHRLVVR